MKRLLVVMTILLGLSLNGLFAENFNLSKSAFKVNTFNANQTEIQFELPDYTIKNVQLLSQNFSKIDIGTTEMLTKEGLPELPIFTISIAIPKESNAQLLSQQVIKQDHLSDIVLYPSQGDEDARKDFIWNRSFYRDNQNYPQENVKVSEVYYMRDFAVVNVTIYPFVYNAKSQSLKINKKINLVIDHQSRGNSDYQITPRLSRAFEPMYKATIANYEQIRSDYPIYQKPSMLILYPTNTQTIYQSELNKLVNWKKQKGFEVTVLEITSGNSNTTSIKAMIQNAYDTWSNKPEYIVLIGDASAGAGYTIPTYDIAYGQFSSYGGAGDYQYTFLEGNDYYGDAIIGRISIGSNNDFATMVAKIQQYERAANIEGTEWFNRNLLVGDTSPSGYSCVIMNKYVKNLKSRYDSNHQFQEIYGADPSASEMQNYLTNGALTFNYRGWIGMSNWSDTNVNALTNIRKLTNAVFLTCSTGGFAGSSMIESITRAGSAAEPKGAITSVGLSTSGTHTAYNNCLMGGIFHAMYSEDITSMGGAMLFSKHYIHRAYGDSELEAARTFAQWLNLMGDPSVNIYRTVPKTFDLTYPTMIPIGSNYVSIVVKDENSELVKDAWVSLTMNNESIDFGVTDENGIVNLQIPNQLTANLTLVVSKQDFQSKLVIMQADTNASVAISSYNINDLVNGNNNQQINPGETIKFSMNINNYTNNNVNNLSVVMRSNNPYITITDSLASVASIGSSSSVNLTDEFTFNVSDNYPANYPLDFMFVMSTSTETWRSMIFENVKSADIDVVSMTVLNTSGIVELGINTPIKFMVKNNGSIPLLNLNAKLVSKSLFIQVVDSLSVYGSINNGMSLDNSSDPFIIQASTGIYPGVKLKAELVFYNSNGYEESEEVEIQVGQISTTDPVPPDQYGYIIYDDTDVSYSDAPVYDWIEISTNGTALDLNDTGENNDKVTTISLPFTFKMYGQSYTQLSVSSNGWVSPGYTEQANFRNLPLPGPLAPRPMIAPYWNDLKKSGANSGVYSYYDSEEHYFVVQWNQMVTLSDNQAVTFQVILYDPVIYGTPLGDSPFKFQYKVFHPGSQGTVTAPNNFITCGIQDHTALRGITYCYNNQYAPGATTLASNRALYFTHPFFLNEAPYMIANAPVIHDQNGNDIIEAGEYINIGLPLTNVGLTTANNLQVQLTTNSPYISIINGSSDYNNINPSGNGTNINYLKLQTLANCPNNHTITITANITSDEGAWVREFSFTVYKPNLTYRSYLINDGSGNANGILEAGESAKLIINFSNTTNLNINNVQAVISAVHPDLTITQNSTIIPVIQATTNYQTVFEFELSETITGETSIPVHVSVSSDNAPDLSFDIQLGVNQSGALLQESFENWLPTGWIIQYFSSHWNQSQTNQAGGIAPEVKFTGAPAFNNITYFISRSMDTTDIASVILSFKHQVNINQPGAIIGVATRALYSPWHTVWSQELTQSINQETKNIPINNEDLGKPNFQICFFVDGPAGNIDEWYIDDVSIQTAIGNTAIVKGQITIDKEDYDLRQIAIKANEYATVPNPEGHYELYLIPGTYTSISSITPFTTGNVYQNVVLESNQLMENVNFTLNYMENPTNLTANVNPTTHSVNLSWEYNLPSTSPFSLEHFKIFRQINSGSFDLLNTSLTESYSDVVNPNYKYRYYIVAQYANGISDSSNVLYVDPNVLSNPENPNIPLKFNLSQNYPNPFNPSTSISFSIPNDSQVKLSVYNIKGQLVKQLKNERMIKGHHTVQWNGINDQGNSVGSGIYFIRLNTETNHSVKKALLLK